jgi:hypothetical protein
VKNLRLLLVCLFALPKVLEAQSDSHLNGLRMNAATPAGQEFFCAGTYTVPECQLQTAFLRAVLQKYEAEKLGKWTWILIRSDDWMRLVSQLHLDPASPAFSHLEYRQTFFDEALLVLKPKREPELITKWNISFDKFLDFAVSHELGHAFCEESDEIKAERYGQRLRKSLGSVCDTKKQHNLLAEVH